MAKEKVKSFAKKNLTKYRIINITLIIGAVALLGLFDFVNLTFALENIMKAEYWGQVAVKGIASTSIYLSISREMTMSLITNDVEYGNRRKEVDTISLLHRGDELNKCLAIYNRQVKIECYKFDINKKIGELDKTADFESQSAWLKYTKSLKNSVVIEPTNEYCQKRLYYMECLKDEYIEENIDNIQVKFDVTYADELTTGREELGVGKSPMKIKVEKSRAKKVGLRLVQLIATAALWGAFLKDVGDNYAFVKIAVSVLFIVSVVVWAILSGLADGKLEFDNIELPKMDFRFQRLKDYVRYERLNNKWDVKEQKIIEANKQ